MEHNHGGLEDHFPFKMGDGSRFHVNLPGCTPTDRGELITAAPWCLERRVPPLPHAGHDHSRNVPPGTRRRTKPVTMLLACVTCIVGSNPRKTV